MGPNIYEGCQKSDGPGQVFGMFGRVLVLEKAPKNDPKSVWKPTLRHAPLHNQCSRTPQITQDSELLYC
jgi:hypothetical protein